jgi:putative copper export protein
MPWFLATLFKLLGYIGLVGLVGVFSRSFVSLAPLRLEQRSSMDMGSLPYVLVVVLSALGYLWMKVSEITGQLLPSSESTEYVQLVLNSAFGDSLKLKILGCAIILGMSAAICVTRRQLWLPVVVVGVMIIVSSSAFSGHTVTWGGWHQVALVLHLVAVALWSATLIFVLLPQWLYREERLLVVRNYSSVARWLVLAIVVSGAYLAVGAYLDPNHDLPTYWFTFGLKVSVLVVIFGLIFSHHKWLAGSKNSADYKIKIANSMRVEIALLLCILLITANLSELG